MFKITAQEQNYILASRMVTGENIVLSKVEQYIKDSPNVTYAMYCNGLDAIEKNKVTAGLFDKIKDLKVTGVLVKFFKNLKEIFGKIVSDFGVSLKDLVMAFKDKNLFAIIKAVGFNLKTLMKALTTATGLVRGGIFKVFEQIGKSDIFQKIRSGAVKIDEVLNKYPILKKLGGLAIAGILLYIWLNMTFIGDLDYDFNFTDLVAALHGNFSIADLFASPSGLMMIALFATGSFLGLSFPWLGASMYNLIVALVYTTYHKLSKKGKFKDFALLKKFKSLIPFKKVAI